MASPGESPMPQRSRLPSASAIAATARMAMYEVVEEIGDGAGGEWMYVLDEQTAEASLDNIRSDDPEQRRRAVYGLRDRALDHWCSGDDDSAAALLRRIPTDCLSAAAALGFAQIKEACV